MADVDITEKMRQVAVGGPAAGAEYAAAQKSVQDLQQKTLADAAERSGQLNAPSAFIAKQNEMLSTPLSAQAASLGTQQAGADAYKSATGSAQTNYLSSSGAVKNLMAQALRKRSAEQDIEQQDKLQATIDKAESRQSRAQSQQEKETKALDKQNEDFSKSRKTFAAQDAAANPDISPNTYKVIADVLSKADDPETAKRLVELYNVDSLDESGGEVDNDLVRLYVLQGLDPDGYAANLGDALGANVVDARRQ